jgi:hypothetical protein
VTGPTGPTGPAGPSSSQLVTGTTGSINAPFAIGATATATATCPAGTVILGGGYEITNNGLGVAVTSAATRSRPTSSTVWSVRVTALVASVLLDGSIDITAYAVCTV